MTMKTIWNNGTESQRNDLLKAIYGVSYIMFAGYCCKDWNSIPYGVQCRLERLNDVRKAQKNK